MGGGGSGMNWEIGIDIYALICIKYITNKNLLYKKQKTKNFKDKHKLREFSTTKPALQQMQKELL